jgi:hypothetical protein
VAFDQYPVCNGATFGKAEWQKRVQHIFADKIYSAGNISVYHFAFEIDDLFWLAGFFGLPCICLLFHISKVLLSN